MRGFDAAEQEDNKRPELLYLNEINGPSGERTKLRYCVSPLVFDETYPHGTHSLIFLGPEPSTLFGFKWAF